MEKLTWLSILTYYESNPYSPGGKKKKAMISGYWYFLVVIIRASLLFAHSVESVFSFAAEGEEFGWSVLK